MVADGVDRRISGTLALEREVSPVPWLALGVVAAPAVVAVGRRRPLAAALTAALVASAIALYVGTAQHAVAPAGSGANPLLVAVPLAGLVAAVLGLALALRRHAPAAATPAPAATTKLTRTTKLANTAALASAAAAAGWAVLRLAVLWKPVLPTSIPYGIDRAGTALALALAVAAAGVAVWGSGITPSYEAGHRSREGEDRDRHSHGLGGMQRPEAPGHSETADVLGESSS